MDPALRKALHNLQGVFDEGFMSKAEYDKRRKQLIDGATSTSTTADAMSDDTTGGNTNGDDTLGPVTDPVTAGDDGDGDGSSGDTDSGGGAIPVEDGCGCTAGDEDGGGSRGWLLGLFGLAALGRRRRRS